MATGETTESVAFIHRILYKQHEDEKTQVYLLVSRYSFLESFHLNSSATQLFGLINRKELLLHFTDFDTMGELQDAELIPTSQIIEVRNLEFELAPDAEPVRSVAHAPAGMIIALSASSPTNGVAEITFFFLQILTPVAFIADSLFVAKSVTNPPVSHR